MSCSSLNLPLAWLPVFDPASPQAESIRHLFITVLVLCALIFVSVVGLIVIAVLRFRAKDSSIPEREFGHKRVEIAWTVGPALVVFWLAVITYKLVLTIEHVPKHAPEPGEPDLVIVGHQWWWEARYPQSGVVAANEIHIPTGRRFRVKLQSADVVHSFWVPKLARKIDAIPGKDNFIALQANRAGTYQGWCTEFCGVQHAWMKFIVVAQEPSRFAQWEQQQLRPLAASRAQPALDGEKLFFAQTCANCHSIRGTDASATAGPDLTHLSSRSILAAGASTNSRESLTRWLRDPQTIKPGCKMPDFKFTDEQVDQLVAYLWGDQ